MNGFINWMEAVLKFLNANSGGLTFVITFVYVVATIAKYSLQGTTQGRYLTGGVPPVRFSM